MKLFLTDQSKNFNYLLKELMNTPSMVLEKDTLTEKVSTIEITTERTLNDINLTCLFDYSIFPTNIMTTWTQWRDEKREIKTEDTILQQVFIPPVNNLSIKIIFGVRVSEIINENNKKGFSYRTIKGHVEMGESTFTLEQAYHSLVFKIHTYSAPGNFLTRLAGPIFTTPYQTYCTQKALVHVKHQIERANL